ncbi:uncharacterized protein Dana_GF11850, isoform C [Drosophila ananassae]|uniref:Uncharacterized protein, isoform C n=1 Tax=Drosophila ananassae TaxID=7217 RepID=B3MF10_DROAN|nr:uncharacterized protein LOC6494712 isoform X2 [Drosophila ananassae]EDV36631.2 uncharacterized protein Dana_GF11850, isoform C [Drosophila ananassae]
MIERRSQLDKIIITAMDRFVWFVLLVVMSHLVTEFTRVSGYARGQRHELVLLNDTLLQPMPVQNMLLYPGQDYGHYPQQHPSSAAAASSPVNSLQQNAALLLSSLAAGAAAGVGTGASAATSAVPGSNGAILALGDTQPAHTAESTYPVFSLRPLIDSIFEIPISTLRAVNNLVGRLTGSYRHAPGPEVSQKSVAAGTALPTGRAASPLYAPNPDPHPDLQRRQMREEMA